MNLLHTTVIKENDFNSVIQLNKGFALIEFCSSSSGWSIVMLNQISKSNNSCIKGINFYQINIDTSPGLIGKYRITTLPKYLLYKNQKFICSFEGLKSIRELETILKTASE